MLYNRVLLNDFPIRLTMIDSHPAQEGLENLDSQAVTAVYNQYFPEVFRYIRYRLGDDMLAEDISSEVFFCLLKAVKSRRGPALNLRAWLIGTAHHMIIDHLRREHRHPSQAISDVLESDGPGPSEQVEGRLASRNLHLALIQLTEDQQQVLALRFGQGYSLEETAAMMKKKINAVKALQFRALNALQRVIGEVK
jgi:RNA polymerase sigma-70 factor (ECF subfamily)